MACPGPRQTTWREVGGGGGGACDSRGRRLLAEDGGEGGVLAEGVAQQALVDARVARRGAELAGDVVALPGVRVDDLRAVRGSGGRGV